VLNFNYLKSHISIDIHAFAFLLISFSEEFYQFIFLVYFDKFMLHSANFLFLHELEHFLLELTCLDMLFN